MVKRSVLIAALLVAILGALGIASATEDSGQTPETVVVPPVVVLPRYEPQETQETRTCVFTVTLRTAPVKNAVERTQMATQPPAQKPPRA